MSVPNVNSSEHDDAALRVHCIMQRIGLLHLYNYANFAFTVCQTSPNDMNEFIIREETVKNGRISYEMRRI